MGEEKKQMTPVVALKTFFGFKPGQTLKEFSEEVKQLSEVEKMNLAKACCEEMGCELITTNAATNV